MVKLNNWRFGIGDNMKKLIIKKLILFLLMAILATSGLMTGVTAMASNRLEKREPTVEINNKKYEKVSDSVRSLDIDGNINFFTNYLSKNNIVK